MFNFSKEFQKVYDELENVESELINDSADKESIKKKLLAIRKEIDECIGYWLQFEEKLGILQEQYNIDIPDQLDESLLSAYLGTTEQESSNLDMQNSMINFRKGLGYFNLDMLAEATIEFEKVIETNPDLTLGHYFLGLAYYFRSEYEKALKKFRLLLELIEDHELKGLICNTIGNIYVEKRDHAKALNYFLRASEYTNSADIYFNCGAVYFSMNDYQNSLNYFLMALDKLENSESDWELHLLIGKVYTYLEKLDKALYHLQIARNHYPNSSEIHFELGLANHLNNNQQQALHEYALARRLSHHDKL